MPEATRQAINGYDFVLASRCAHTLKGVAANLGADHCSSLAAALEQAANQHASVMQLFTLLAPLEQHLSELVANIARALPNQPPQPDAGVGELTVADATLVRTVCQTLADLLAHSDAAAEQAVNAHGTLLRTALGGERFDALLDLVQNFEHAGALDALYAAATAANIDLGHRN
jgi:HPt (histidine-containing phosphotransfer) domain-containing protein